MKNKLFLSLIILATALVNCPAQVPDSMQAKTQVPVIQQDTFPKDSIPEPSPLHPNDPLASSDTASVNSLIVKKSGFLRRFLIADYPNPNKALYLSLAFPAGGQIYNRRWWKPPIIWAGYGGLIYAVRYNTRTYNRLKTAYLAELNHELHEFSGRGLDAGDLKRLRDQYDKDRQLSYIGIFILHLVQSAEAFVDCHLKTFDVSDDLSFRLKPSMEYTPDSSYPTIGIGFAFSIAK